MDGGRVKPQTQERFAEVVGTLIGKFLVLATRAVVIMFVAAVIAKRFSVVELFELGYVESLAWAAGYGLVRGLFHKDEEDAAGQ